jgi:hypothetical protein
MEQLNRFCRVQRAGSGVTWSFRGPGDTSRSRPATEDSVRHAGRMGPVWRSTFSITLSDAGSQRERSPSRRSARPRHPRRPPTEPCMTEYSAHRGGVTGPLAGPHRTRGTLRRGHRGNEPFSGWTRTFTLAVRRLRRLSHLRRADHRNRHHQLPACPRPWPALGEAGSAAG